MALLREVSKVNQRYIAFWLNSENGQTIQTELTEIEYKSLDRPRDNHGNPPEPSRRTLPEGTWAFIYAVGGVPVFNTVSGELEDYCLWIDNTRLWLQLPGREVETVAVADYVLARSNELLSITPDLPFARVVHGEVIVL